MNPPDDRTPTGPTVLDSRTRQLSKKRAGIKEDIGSSAGDSSRTSPRRQAPRRKEARQAGRVARYRARQQCAHPPAPPNRGIQQRARPSRRPPPEHVTLRRRRRAPRNQMPRRHGTAWTQDASRAGEGGGWCAHQGPSPRLAGRRGRGRRAGQAREPNPERAVSSVPGRPEGGPDQHSERRASKKTQIRPVGRDGGGGGGDPGLRFVDSATFPTVCTRQGRRRGGRGGGPGTRRRAHGRPPRSSWRRTPSWPGRDP